MSMTSMAPPPASAGAESSRPSSRQNGDGKEDGIVGQDDHSGHYEVAGHDNVRKDDGYPEQQSNGYDTTDRNNYYEVNGSASAPQSTSPNGRSSYDNANGSTPRTSNGSSTQWSGSYTTSPRNTSEQAIPRQPPQRAVFGMLNGESDRDGGDGYGSTLPTLNSVYQAPNGISSSKRIREIDDDEEEDGRPSSRGEDRGDDNGLKRRKTISQPNPTTPPVGVARSRSQLVGGARSNSRR